MRPLTWQRGARIPLLVVIFSWLAVGSVLSQDKPPAGQPTTKPASTPTSQPVVRPSAPPASAPATHPATQEAQQRLARYQEMQQAAAKNGKNAATASSTQAATESARDKSLRSRTRVSKEERERRLAEMRAGREDARRRLLDKRQRRQAEARGELKEDAALRGPEEVQAPVPERPAVRRITPEPPRELEADERRSPLPPYGSTPWRPSVEPQPPEKVMAAPAEPRAAPVKVTDMPVEPPPPSGDGRDYFISFVDMAWEDVVAHYAKLAGKPLMGDLIIGGELTYESDRRFTKEEMRDELNFLLLEQGSFIIEKEDYVYLVPTSELTKELELDRVFESVAAFEAANLRDLEICSVLIQVKDRPATEIRDMLSPSMPDRALPVVVGNTNKIKITGLAQDVRRFQGLLGVIDAKEFDPHQTRFIKVETNVRQIEQMVRDYFRVSQPRRQYDRQKRQFVTVGVESAIVIIPDERTKNLIVKATPAKLDEIEEFINTIDQKPDLGEFKTTVIPVQYGSATDIANLLNQILRQEQGQRARTPARPTPRRTARGRTTPQRRPQPAQPAAPEDIIVEDIYERAKKTVRIVADARTNNLVVYANEDGLQRVTEILEQIDQPVPSNFKTFQLEHARAEQIQPTIEQIARGVVSAGRGRSSRAPTVVADPSLNVLHVVAEREDMNRIETIIRGLDVEAAEDQWHFVELHNITASEAARMIAPVLRGGGGGTVRRPSRPGMRGASRAAPTSQTIPLDEANTLLVICSDEEWVKAEQLIKIADENAVTNRPEIQFFKVENGNPQTIASTVTQLYGNYQHPVLGRSRTFVDTLGQQIVVQGVKPALEEIAALVTSLDVVPEENPLVILPLEFADATQVAQIAQGLLPPSPGRGRRGLGGSLQADPVTNALIIQADKLTVDRIKAFATDMEQQVAAQKPERRYYSLKNAVPRDVVSAINSLFGGMVGGRRGRGPVGTQVKTVIVGNQVVVDAPASKQREIEVFVQQLDELSDKGITTVLVKMPGADVRNIAGRLTNAFRDRVRQQGVTARFEPDTTTETILMTCSKDVLEEAEALLSQYEELSSEHVWKIEGYQLKHANANDAARWLQGQLVSLVSQQMSSSVVRQIKVTADMRTNRIFINAPELAAKQGLLLLEQYDTPAEQPPQAPMDVWTVKLPGLDVRNLASQLQRNLSELMKGRPDRLRAIVTADQLTNNLIITAPSDMKPKVDELIGQFSAETEDMTPVQKFIEIKNADAEYVAGQVRSILDTRIGRVRGRGAAQQVSITVDTRLNRIIINAPKFAIEMAEALASELDQAATYKGREIRTIPLENADASFVSQVLQNVMREQIRTKRTLQISVEPMTNSLIVSGGKEDFEEIERWAKDLDSKAAEVRTELRVIEVNNANPWEVVGVLTNKYSPKRHGQRRQIGSDYSFSVMANTNIVVQAPAEKLEEIEALIAELDQSAVASETPPVVIELKYADPGQVSSMINQMFGRWRQTRKTAGAKQQVEVTVSNNLLIVRAPAKELEAIQELVSKVDAEDPGGLEIKMYDLKVLNATQVAVQVQMFLRSTGRVARRGQMQPGAFPEPTTNTLVVIAPADQLPFIDTLIAQIEAKTPDEAITQTYVLKNARADQVQRHVDQMLRAKIAEREGSTRGRATQQRTAVMADPDTNRLFVFAPSDYQELAAELVRMLDEEVEIGEIVHIVPLENGDATQVAQTVTQTMQGAGVRGRGTAPMKVKVVPDVGSNSIILAGLPKDVAEVERLVKDLEAASETIPELQYFSLEYAMPYEVAEALRGIFPPSRSFAETVTVTEDEYYNRLLVTANKRKMRQVEAIIAQLDAAPEEAEGDLLAGGKQLYFIDISKGEGWDIAMSVEEFFPPRERGGPTIESDWFNEYLTVICRPSEFPKIEQLIRKFEARAKPEIVIRAIDLPGGGERRERLFQYLRARELDFQIEQAPEMKETESIIIELHPEEDERAEKPKPRAQAAPRGGLPHLFGGVVLTTLLQVKDTPTEVPETAGAPALGAARTEEPLRREPPTVQMLPDGRIMIRGSRDAVEEIEDAIELFEEDLSRGEVIRIFRFRYGDVNAASRILDMMFNERQIRLPQQRQQPQQQQQQRGRGGRGDEKDQQQQGMLQQIQQMIGGRAQPGARGVTGGQRVRIATDASHNYLIVKCDEALLPDIIQLLRELDIAPADVEIEVFQLKNLEAAETANNIKEVLGITKARSRRPTQPARGRSPQQQLLEVLQQQMVSLAGAEGSAKIESVEIVPNTVTNSLLVSAPPDVMGIIRNVLTEMEALEGGDIVVIKHVVLKEARVDDVLPLLQEIFGAAGGAGRGPGAKRGSPADLGPVTISGDPRSNTLIFVAQAKDVDTVYEQIEKLDIKGAIAEVEMYICQYGDAVGIAQAVSEMFVTGAGARGRGPRGRGVPQAANLDIRITAEPATNTILVFAPEDKRQIILDQIEQLDRENRFDIREIPVVFAKPRQVADKLLQIFGGSGGSAAAQPGGGRRGGPRRQAAQTPGRIVVIPDESGKQLLVRAPDETFAKMKELVELLDQPSEQLLIRTFMLKHADASVVVESVKGAMLEFMQLQRQLGDEELGIDAFTAVADPRTNSVIVVGSQETFMFVEQIIDAIDGDTPAEQQKQFRIFVLDRSDATVVADAINSFAAGGRAAPAGRRSPGRGRRGGVVPALSTGAIIDVQAIADPSTNSVMVYGRPDDIDMVEQMVIEELEGTLGTRYEFATIEVKDAVPTQLISYIQQFLDQRGGQADGGRRAGAAAAGRQGPRIIGNDNAKTIIVHGSKRQIEEVRALVERFDNKDTQLGQVDIVTVPWGQDPHALAETVERVVNEGEREWAERMNRQPRLITVVADDYTNTILIHGDPAQAAVAKTVIGQLSEIRPEKPVTRIIELVNLSSAEAEQLINDLQQRRSPGGSIRGGSRSPSLRRTPSRTPSRRSTPSRTPSRSPRRRGSNWNPSSDWRRQPLEPAGFATPVVGTGWFTPSLVTVLVTQVAEPEQPQAEQPVPEQPPTPREEQQQQMLSSISGQLRGEIIATPLDSRRIIVTGDQDDVDFIVQMLALMERSTPEAIVEVFQLQHAKAAALAPLLDQAVRAYIEQRSGVVDRIDKISIIAEARSNSVIVTASEPNMALIEEMILKLDFATLAETQPKLVPLKHMRASEAVSLLSQAIQELNKIRDIPAASQASIQAIERSNAVLIVGTPADITEIEGIIEGIDVELPPEESFTTARVVVLELKNATAEDLAETLNALIEVERATGGQAGRGRATESIVRKLLISTPDGRELPPLDLDKPIRILPEKGKNALIIFSTPKNNEALVEIAGLFDELPAGDEIEVKSFALQHANAEQVADLLQTMFDDAKKALRRPSEGEARGLEKGVLPPVPPGIAGRGLPYNVVVSHDARSNAVFVVGHRDSVLLAAGLITELDRPSVELTLKPHVVQLRNIQATTLQEKLEDLLEKRLDALGSDKNEARDSAIIEADDRSNMLIVLATREIFEMVDDLAMQLDHADPYSVVDSEFRRLEYADAAKLAGLLQELFDKKKDAEGDVAEGGQKNVLHVFADARSNSLMLTGTRDYLLEANDLVDHLDQAFDPTVQFKLYPVRLNSAANIATLLQEMIEESRKQQEKEMQGTPIHVAADPYSNNLLLAASAEDMLMLERWIEVLDRPAEPGRITRIIPLKRGSAQELAQSAQELFGAQARGAEADVTVTHDETTNSVIVIGPPAVVNDIEDFITELNEAEGADAVVKIFKLEEADAEDAGELLRSILEGRGGTVGGGTRGGGSRQEEFNQVMLVFQREHPDLGLETLRGFRSEIVVIDDLRTNSLVVTAPLESMPLMESLVAAIDVPPDAAKIRVFKLRNSDAEEMMTMLEELFEAEEARARGGEGEEELRLELGEGLGAGGRQRLAFTVDTRTNSVIAAGTTGYLDLVEELILQLDTQPIEERKTYVYHPEYNEAVAIQQVLSDYNDREQQLLSELEEEISPSERMRREVLAIASEDTNRIVLGYDPRRESEVLDLVRDLDQPPPQVMIQVLIVEVTMDSSLELGVEFAFQDLQFTKAGPTDTTTFDFVGGTDIGAAGTGLGGFTFTITGADFNFLIRTLQNEGNLNILSRPQIVAMDNQEAHIKITNDVPFAAGVTVTATGIVQTTVNRREVGIDLTVTPHINPDGFVRMEIKQTVSDITGSTVDIGQGLTSPIFLDREAETVVTVKDNETVVLGGLITTRDETREQKVPLVGDVPLLGWLFKNQNTQTSHTELLVILTPRVVRTIEDYRELSFEERDGTGVLPDEVLTSELMSGLRVPPEELSPSAAEDMLGPFPPIPPVEEEPGRYDEEVYGPIHSSAPEDEQDERDRDPDSYDVPISWAQPNSKWAYRSTKRRP